MKKIISLFLSAVLLVVLAAPTFAIGTVQPTTIDGSIAYPNLLPHVSGADGNFTINGVLTSSLTTAELAAYREIIDILAGKNTSKRALVRFRDFSQARYNSGYASHIDFYSFDKSSAFTVYDANNVSFAAINLTTISFMVMGNKWQKGNCAINVASPPAQKLGISPALQFYHNPLNLNIHVPLASTSSIAYLSGNISYVDDLMPPPPASHPLTIHYQHEDGTQAAPAFTVSQAAGSAYSIVSPSVDGYTPDRPMTTGTMPDAAHTEIVTYTRDQSILTVRYLHEDGTQAAAPYASPTDWGVSYNIVSPAVDGYTPDHAAISGIMPQEATSHTVTYIKDKPQYKLSIHYRHADGTEAAPTHHATITAGAAYEIPSPAVTGYTPDILTASGTMPEQDTVINVTYSRKTPMLRIHYQHTDNSQAAPSIATEYYAGMEYLYPSPDIEGYTPDQPMISGTMPEDDVTIYVTYSKAQYTLNISYQYENGTQAAEPYSQAYAYGAAYSVPSPTIPDHTPNHQTMSGIVKSDLSMIVTYRANDASSSSSSGSSSSESGGTGEGESSSSTPEIDNPIKPPVIPPYDGYNPFEIPDFQEYTGYDPFKLPDFPEYTGYNPFKMPDYPVYDGKDSASCPCDKCTNKARSSVTPEQKTRSFFDTLRDNWNKAVQ